MGLSAWIGLFAASIMAVMYYMVVTPPWMTIKWSLATGTTWVGAGFVNRLEWMITWAPIIFVVIALFWAFVSPVRDEGISYRSYGKRRY